MIINGERLKTIDVFKNMMTVPDCIVVSSNKIGKGHGEEKFYISSKKEMYNYYGDEGFSAQCFMLKKDLISYMDAIKVEYDMPSYNYSKKDAFPLLWKERKEKISNLPDIIFFNIYDQYQIEGSRGYINSTDNGYRIIREIALPLVTFIRRKLFFKVK